MMTPSFTYLAQMIIIVEHLICEKAGIGNQAEQWRLLRDYQAVQLCWRLLFPCCRYVFVAFILNPRLFEDYLSGSNKAVLSSMMGLRNHFPYDIRCLDGKYGCNLTAQRGT
eukprot:Gb_34394 [translate_table: standard]